MEKAKREKKFVENNFIIVPAKNSGLRGIGDLWDCRNAKALGLNLFGGRLKAGNRQAFPRKSLDYTFKHIKSTKDRKSTLGAGLELTATILFVEITDSGTNEIVKSQNVENDEIQIEYNIETFSVKATNSASSLISEQVLRQISAQGRSTQELIGTHAVVETIVGGKITATIKIDKTIDKLENKNKFGILVEPAMIRVRLAMAIIAGAMAAVGFGNNQKHDINFTIDSELPINSQPQTVDQMFSLIDSLDSLIAKEKHFPDITEYEVTGIELRHVMAPLSSYLSPNIAREVLGPNLYEEIEKDLQESFLDMLMTLKDYQYNDMIKVQIVDGSKNDKLRPILVDKNNVVTKEITEREGQLKIISEEFMERALQVFTQYRFAQKSIIDIENIIAEFHIKFNATELFHEMIQFRNKVRQEYRTIEKRHNVIVADDEDDTFVSKISTFTNKEQVETWWTEGNSGKVKILIQTSFSQGKIGNTLKEFWQLDKSLENFPVIIGVAAPSVFNENLIRIKTGSIEKSYSEKKFSFVVEVISIAVGKGSSWLSKTFHELNAAQDGIVLPLFAANFSEINNLLANLDGVSETKVCTSYLQLQDTLTASYSKDRYQIVTTLEAEDTAYDAVIHLKRFRKVLAERIPETYSKCDWIIGDFGLFDYNEAPVVFFFKNNELLSICFDNLDLLMLTDFLELSEYNNQEPDLTLLSPAQIDSWYSNWLYPTRVVFAKEVAKLYGLVHNDEMLKNNSRSSLLGLEENKRVIDTMKFVRDCLSGNQLQIISSAAVIALYYYADLEYVLVKHGWDIAKQTFKLDFLYLEQELGMFLKDLRNYASTLSPFQAKIQFYLRELKKAITDDDYRDLNIERILDELLAEPELPTEIATPLGGYQPDNGKWPMGKPNQVQGIYDVLDEYSANQFQDKDGEGKTFYLHALIGLVGQIFNPKDEDAPIKSEYKMSNGKEKEEEEGEEKEVRLEIKELLALEDLAVDYVNKLTEKYPDIPSVILPTLPKEKLVKHLAKNNIFQALSILARCKFVDGYHFLILQELNEISTLGDEIWLTQFIRKLGRSDFENGNIARQLYPQFWENDKFKYLLRTGLDNDSLLECIYIFQCESGGIDNIPKYIPKDFANRLREIAFQRKDFALDITWVTEEHFVKTLQTIFAKKIIPRDFMLQMTREFYKNEPLKNILLSKGALIYWNDTSKHFTEPWDLLTVKDSIDKSISPQTPSKRNKQEENAYPIVNFTSENVTIPVEGELKEFCGESISTISLTEYSKISEAIYSPEIWKYPNTEWMALLIPFILQRLRMKSIREYKNDYFVPSRKTDEFQSKISAVLTRGEIQTCIMSAADSDVALDVLRNISEFPIALPLVTRDVEKDGRMIFLYHLLNQVELKYSLELSNPYNKIFSTKLFQGNSKIIVVAQIGQHQENNVTNRILETVLAKGDFFCSEKALGTHGNAELIPLTKTTCSERFWDFVVKDFYNKEATDPILLVKVNGDTENNPAMRNLAQMASAVMVFIMPGQYTEIRAAWKKFRRNLGMDYTNFIKLMVDPTPSCIDKANDASKIRFDLITIDNKPEQDRLFELFTEAILFRAKSYKPSDFIFDDKKIVSKGMILNQGLNQNRIINLFNSNLNLNIEDLDTLALEVQKSFPNLRIYVISISGMKNSGKSTLLNSLFGTKFHKNSDGIKFQLIFLNNFLQKEFHADAILVVDSEGMTSTTNTRQPKDTKLTSLIMSISNVCIVNVMGSRMKELNNILNVALVSQMRFKNPVENCPGIVLAEQTDPGKNDRSSANLAELNEIVQSTIKLCSDRETDMGVQVRTSQRILNSVVNTKVWELLKKFRRFSPFTAIPDNIVFPPSQEYHKDVFDFYKILLKNFKATQTSLLFTDWVEMVKSNAKLINEEDFNLRFDSVEDLQSYFHYLETFRQVKYYYDHAMRIHQLHLEREYIFNNKNEKSEDLNTMLDKFSNSLQLVPDACEYTAIDNDCSNPEKCLSALDHRDRLLKKAQKYSYRKEFETRLGEYKKDVSDHIVHQLSQKFVVNQMIKAIENEDIVLLLKMFTIPAQDFDGIVDVEVKFDRLYSLTAAASSVISSLRLYKQEIKIEYEFAPQISKLLDDPKEDLLHNLPKLESMTVFDVEQKDSEVSITWDQKEWLENQLLESSHEIYFYSRDSQGKIDLFEFGMARKWRLRIDEIIQEFESKCRKSILIDFRWAVHEYGVKLLAQDMLKLQDQWNEDYQPINILQQQRDEIIKMWKAHNDDNQG